jgi:hypothetical protein
MSNSNVLLNGLKGQERKDVEDAIRRASTFLSLVSKRIEEELKQESDPDFDSPSWAYKQAYQLGYKRGLTKLLKYAILLPSKE